MLLKYLIEMFHVMELIHVLLAVSYLIYFPYLTKYEIKPSIFKTMN